MQVISTIPYALGALCLNQAGMDFVLSRPQLIRLLVNSPTNPAYRDVLKERDNAAYLGSSLDELARHHTPLKAVLHEALFDMLRALAKMGQKARWAGLDKVADYKLILDTDQSTSGKPQSAPEMPAPEEDVEQHMDVVLWLSSQVSLSPRAFDRPTSASELLIPLHSSCRGCSIILISPRTSLRKGDSSWFSICTRCRVSSANFPRRRRQTTCKRSFATSPRRILPKSWRAS